MAKKKKRLTNVELVTAIMESFTLGPLAQCFVIEAITRYAEQVAASDPKDYGRGFNGEHWIRIGKEIKKRLDEQYGEP